MSGHSKWSKVKHQKEATDAVKGKVFTRLSKAIIIAVKEGGGNTDPNFNFKLRLAVDKARSANMPKENIERAIEKAKGAGANGTMIEEVIYEAFGPAGVGIIIEAATENKQRTVAEVKNVLERNGGVLAGTGAVSHLFKHVGCITVLKKNKTFDEIMEVSMNIGALDLADSPDSVEVYTVPSDLHKVKDVLTKAGIEVTSSELIYKPVSVVPVNDQSRAKQVLRLLSTLELVEDVDRVFANFDIPDEYLH